MSSVLFFMPLPPPVHGSSVMSGHILESKIIRERIDCDYINISTSRSMSEIGNFTPMKPLRYLAALTKTLKKLIFNKYDVCYIALTCHGKGFLKDAPFALLCKMFGKRLIIHQHNKGMSSCINRFPYKFLIPLVYKNAKVILLSWRLYDDVRSVVDKSQVVICQNGIPDTTLNLKKESHDIPHILFLSNLIKFKGVIDLLDACSILKKNGVQFVCDYVGKETSEITARKFDEKVRIRGLEGVVLYHGAKYGEEKERMWVSANVFVFPTFNDAFPLVILEAMQHGVPVIATDEGGIPDIIEDEITGFIIPKHNVQCLANKNRVSNKEPHHGRIDGSGRSEKIQRRVPFGYLGKAYA